MASIPPLPLPRKQSRNFAFTQASSKMQKHNRIREYILYLCPQLNTKLNYEINEFWQTAKTNGYFGSSSHNYSIPHITLVSFFKVSYFILFPIILL
jgi:hypothetical protein